METDCLKGNVDVHVRSLSNQAQKKCFNILTSCPSSAQVEHL